MEKISPEEIKGVEPTTEGEQELTFEDLKNFREELLGESKYRVYFNEEIAKFAKNLKKKYPKENLESYSAYNDFMGITIRVNQGEDEGRPKGPIVDVDKEDFTDPEDSILEFAKKLRKENQELLSKKEGEPIGGEYHPEWFVKYKELRDKYREIINDESSDKDYVRNIQNSLHEWSLEIDQNYIYGEANQYVLFHVVTFSGPDKKEKFLGCDMGPPSNPDAKGKTYSIENKINELYDDFQKRKEMRA